MDSKTIALAALVGAIAFIIYMAIDAYYRKMKQSEELRKRVSGGETYDMGAGDDALMSMEQKLSPLAESMVGLLKMVGVDEATFDKIDKRIKLAGLGAGDATIYYLFTQRILSFVWVFVSLPFFMSDKSGTDYALDIIVGIVILTLGVFGPYLFVQNNIDKRKKILARSFPDALDLLLVCVESGLALDAALTRVTRELGRAHPEITRELNKTRLELALLNDRTQALLNMGDRTDLVPFRSLAAALIQTEKFGTSLTDTLRVLSDDYRQTRLLIAENKAARLPAMITVPLILFLMPAFMMVILGPAIIKVKMQGGIFGNGG